MASTIARGVNTVTVSHSSRREHALHQFARTVHTPLDRFGDYVLLLTRTAEFGPDAR